MEGRTKGLPVFFTAAAAGAQLQCCIRQTGEQDSDPTYELLVVEASRLLAWSTLFGLAAVNAALQDEELSVSDLDQVLAVVLPCQQAVVAVMQPDNALRLEAWCHRTARVPLLPPTQQQRAPDTDYRQAAFCISLPVSPDLSQPQWMVCHTDQGFADINAGMLSACFHHEQQLQDSVLLLQSQLQLLHSHTTQLQHLAGKAVTTAVRGTAGLKEDPTKQQLNVSTSIKGTTGTRAGAVAALSTSQGSAPVPFIATGSQMSPAKGLGALGTGSSSIPVQRAGSGGSNRAAGGAAAGGGRAHLARQQQDEQALRQLWAEQQSLQQAWHSRLQQLVTSGGELHTYEQLATEAGVCAEVAAGRHAVALPWHLGQQEDEQQQQPQGGSQRILHEQQQQQDQERAQTFSAVDGDQSVTKHVQPTSVYNHAPVTAPPGFAQDTVAAASTTHLGAASTSPAAGLPSAPGLVTVVAPARQKQAAAQKRKAADVQSLLKRGRR